MKSKKPAKNSKKNASKYEVIKFIDELSFRKTIVLLCSLIITMSLILYNQFIFGSFLYFFKDIGYDTITLYWPNYYNVVQSLREFSVSFWSFKMGIGTNIYASSQYFMDPFTYIFVILGEESIAQSMIFVVILKHVLAGTFTFLFLNELKLSKKVSLFSAVIFAFNGYLVLWGQHYHFGTFVAFIPLMLYGYERFLRNKGFFVLVISTIILVNFTYLFYQLSLFLVVFLLFRTFLVNEWNMAKSIRKSSVGVGLIFLAICITSVILMPKLMLMGQNPRIEGSSLPLVETIFSMESIKYYIQLIFHFFSNDISGSGIDYIKEFAVIERNGINISYFNYYEYPVIYSGILSLIILPFGIQYFKDKNKKAIIVILSLLVLSLVFPFFSFIFNGFKTVQYRWVFIVPVLVSFISAFAMNNILTNKEIKRNLVLISAITSIILLILAILLSNSILTNSDEMSKIAGNSIPIFILIILYSTIISTLQKNKNQLYITLFIITLIELMFINYPAVNNRNLLSSELRNPTESYYDGSDIAINRIKESDKEFYRINKMHNLYLNDALKQNFYAVSSYNSLNNPSYVEFLRNFRDKNEKFDSESMMYLQYPKDSNVPYLSSFLGIKYVLSRDENLLNKGMKKVGSTDGFNIFRNQYSLPLGMSYNEFIDNETYEKFDPFTKKKLLMKCTVLENESVSKNKSLSKYIVTEENIKFGNSDSINFVNCKSSLNNFPESINYISDKISVLEIPIEINQNSGLDNIDTWLNFRAGLQRNSNMTVNFIINGKLVRGLTTNVDLENPLKDLSFKLPIGTTSCLLSFPDYVGTVKISEMKIYEDSFDEYSQDISRLKANNFEIDSFEEDKITGKFEAKKDELILFTIPYDVGWTLTLNEVETELFEVQKGMLGTFIRKGNYNFVLEFTPSGFYLGLMVSIISISLLIVALVLKKRRVSE